MVHLQAAMTAEINNEKSALEIVDIKRESEMDRNSGW